MYAILHAIWTTSLLFACAFGGTRGARNGEYEEGVVKEGGGGAEEK